MSRCQRLERTREFPHLLLAAGAPLKVCGELTRLGLVKSVEGVERGEFVIGAHASSSTSCRLNRCMPSRILVFTVPSGTPSLAETCWWVHPS